MHLCGVMLFLIYLLSQCPDQITSLLSIPCSPLGFQRHSVSTYAFLFLFSPITRALHKQLINENRNGLIAMLNLKTIL